jgi:phospholipid/cholesterol/gamma-HCH transport system substrate-binding protein
MITRRVGQAAWRSGVLLVTAVMLASCGWHGVANVPMPGGPGTGRNHMRIFVQMPDTLALNANSLVTVADVNVGTVRGIELKNWVATLTLDLQPDLKLPANTLAKISQTRVLGTQQVELDMPPNPSPQLLRSGDTIPLKNASAFPTTERVLASISTVMRGGGIPNLETIQTEVNNALDGRADQIRDFLGRLDTFTAELNKQTDDIIHAIDASNRLLSIVAARNSTLDQVLTDMPPLIKHFSETRDVFANASEAMGRFSDVTHQLMSDARSDFETNVRLMQQGLKQLGRASPYILGALKFMMTSPFSVDNIAKVVRGDYMNISATIDLTLSSVDNAILTGTGVSGMLRALEQSWGRDPATMIPDIRYTPNPAFAPVERGEE